MNWELKKTDPAEAREHFENKMRFTLGPVEVQYYRDQKIPMTIIDVRSPEAFAEGHVPGAVNLPEENWESLVGLRKDLPNIIYCYSVVCHLAAKACLFYAGRGYSVIEMDGGYEYWKQYELEEEIDEDLTSSVDSVRDTEGGEMPNPRRWTGEKASDVAKVFEEQDPKKKAAS